MTGSLLVIRIWCALLLCRTVFSLKSGFLSRMVSVRLASAQHPAGYQYLFDRYPPYVNTKFAIMGGGAFSLALSKVLSHKSILCDLLVRNQSVAEHINAHHRHPKYLPDLLIPNTVRATTDPGEALKDANYVIHAVPMQESRSYLKSMKSFMKENVPILSVAKGIERNTCKLMSEIIVEELGENQRCAFLSGPSFAREIMESQPTAVVIASTEAALAKELAEVLSCVEFRCHTSSDVAVRCCTVATFFYCSDYILSRSIGSGTWWCYQKCASYCSRNVRRPRVRDEHDVLVDHSRLCRNDQVRRLEKDALLRTVVLYRWYIDSQYGIDHGCKRRNLRRLVRCRRHIRHLFGTLIAQQVIVLKPFATR